MIVIKIIDKAFNGLKSNTSLVQSHLAKTARSFGHQKNVAPVETIPSWTPGRSDRQAGSFRVPNPESFSATMIAVARHQLQLNNDTSLFTR
jgi:hypothetical protein